MFDVMVVGAGLAGLQAAGALGRRGHRVALVDLKPSPDRRVHTTGIFVRRTFAEFDLPPGTLGPPIRNVVVESPAGRRLELTSVRDEFRVGRMQRLYRTLLDEAVEAGVEWLGGTRFRGARSSGDGWVASLDRGGRTWTARTRVLVGADGARSRVARALSLEENREWLSGVEEVYDGRAHV